MADSERTRFQFLCVYDYDVNVHGEYDHDQYGHDEWHAIDHYDKSVALHCMAQLN
jgi:hypothetical protein